MSDRGKWLFELGDLLHRERQPVNGLVRVHNFEQNADLSPEQYVILEKARGYEAHAVFFSIGPTGKDVAEAFVYLSDQEDEENFKDIYRKLWSWGGVPLIYRQCPGLVKLFRCSHKSEIQPQNGILKLKPLKLTKASK